jgi:hypothetical protein
MPNHSVSIDVEILSAPIVTRAQEAIVSLEIAAHELAEVLEILGCPVSVSVQIRER